MKVLDINGQELREGAGASLLCEILEVTHEGVRIRVLNSEMVMLVSISHDEVLGGLVAGSELTAFLEKPEEAPSQTESSSPVSPA